MLRRIGLDGAACFPSSHAASSSALRAYVSTADGNMVAPSATSDHSPAKQTAVIRKNCTANQAAQMRFAIISPMVRTDRHGFVHGFRLSLQLPLFLRAIKRRCHKRREIPTVA